MARVSKKDPLYDKSYRRTRQDTITERDLGYGRLKDYYNNRKVEVRWGYDPEMTAENLFMISIDGKQAVLDREEVLKFLRWA